MRRISDNSRRSPAGPARHQNKPAEDRTKCFPVRGTGREALDEFEASELSELGYGSITENTMGQKQ